MPDFMVQIIGKTDDKGDFSVRVLDKATGRDLSGAISAVEFPEINGRNAFIPPKVKLTVRIDDFLLDAEVISILRESGKLPDHPGTPPEPALLEEPASADAGICD